MKRLMLAAPASGSGKTVLTCGLLAALTARGIGAEAFKCGPDYIDPMFHQKVLGVPSRNLDLFLQGERGVRKTIAKQSRPVALIEGAMGYYDGVNGTAQASAWHLATAAKLPVVLAVRPGGSSLTLAAQIQGLQKFRLDSRLRGLVLTLCKPSLHAHLKPILERETGLPVLGYLPPLEAARIESRHLGLQTAGEIQDLARRFAQVAAQLEKTVDLDALLALADEVPDAPKSQGRQGPKTCTIAVARDEAFCFYYADNLDALEAAGAELVFFSPLQDEVLPKADGLYLGGGYPELYAKELSENQSMRREIGDWLKKGLPCLAECGGFMYLHEQMEGMDGKFYPMAGAFEGSAYRTPKLNRFGYVNLRAEHPVLGEDLGTIRAHEFHYFDSENCGCDFQAQKPVGSRGWRCMHGTDSQLCGFPHLYYCGSPQVAAAFLKQCGKTQARRRCENPMGAKGEKRKWQE